MTSELKSPMALAAFLGTAVAAAALGVAVMEYTKDDSSTARVAECRASHDAPQKPDEAAFAQGRWTGCSWPPPAGAASDGYGVITLKRADNGAASTAGYQGADLLQTDCETVEIKYRHDQQGVQAISPAMRADVGQVLKLVFQEGAPAALEVTSLPPYVPLSTANVAEDYLVVLVPIAVSVTYVACV